MKICAVTSRCKNNHYNRIYMEVGIVGYIEKGSVTNCIALNPEIVVHNDYRQQCARVVGNGNPGQSKSSEGKEEYTLAGNTAFSNMIGSFPSGKGATTVNGADITIDEILDDGTLGKKFAAKDGWTIEKGKLPGLFGKTVDIPEHLFKSDAIVSHEREVPVGSNLSEVAVAVIALPNRLTAEFLVGPNPADKQTGIINFYLRDKQVKSGPLTIYNASGNVINKVKIRDRYPYPAASTQERRNVGSWDLRDKKGRPVPDGTYLVRGTITASNGKSEKVSAVVGVAAQR